MIDSTKKTVLQFSGGVDSLACLYLLKDCWGSFDVFWLDTGSSFPESKIYFEKLSLVVPRMKAIQGFRPQTRAAHGYPVDFVDAREQAERFGMLAPKQRPFKTLPFYECCHKSIWQPMHDACAGYEVIIRGQREQESLKSPVQHGQVIDGVQYLMPVQGWSKKQVFEFLKKEGAEIPRQYAEHENAQSLDCMDCTAFVDENSWKMAYMKKHHPKEYADLLPVKKYINLRVVEHGGIK